MSTITEKTDLDGLTLLGGDRKPVRKLETFPNHNQGRDYLITMRSGEFTCLCPATGQPDFAELTIQYIPGQKILSQNRSSFICGLSAIREFFMNTWPMRYLTI